MCFRLRDDCSGLRIFCRRIMVCLHLLKEADEYDASNESTDVTPVINKESVNEIKDDKKEDNEKSLASVKVVIPMTSEVTKMFSGVFEEKLKENGFKAIMTDVTQVIAESDATCNDVLIVICHNFSRLESNVRNVLKCFQVDQYQKIVLIILHTKSKDNLPKQSSKGEIIGENDEFKSLHNIVDIAFTEKDGIYDCEMNKSAFQTIIDAASRKSNSEKEETKDIAAN